MCGICMVYNVPDASKVVKAGLVAQEHRGQNGVGISIPRGTEFPVFKTGGTASHAMQHRLFDGIDGDARHAVGHVRYPTFGGSDDLTLERSAQPEAWHGRCSIVMAHNGNINNGGEIGRRMETEGVLLVNQETDCDVKYLLGALACELRGNDNPLTDDVFGAIEGIQGRVEGAFSATGLIAGRDGKIRGYAFKDPYGIRPMVVGSLGDGFVVASETTALKFIGAEFAFEPEPGEAIVFDENGPTRRTLVQRGNAPCIFEYIYFASPDSVMYGASVGGFRFKLGYELARGEDCEFDLVMPVPRSGFHHSEGYVNGMWEHHRKHVDSIHVFVTRGGRVFIDPSSDRRDRAKKKQSPVEYFVRGKRVATVDDSTVRGTTALGISEILRDAGATEVHQRASAGLVSPCFYGIDFPSLGELTLRRIYQAVRESHADWDERRVHREAERFYAKQIGAKSFRYNTPEVIVGVLQEFGIPNPNAACLNGVYPTPDGRRLLEMAKEAGSGRRVYETGIV